MRTTFICITTAAIAVAGAQAQPAPGPAPAQPIDSVMAEAPTGALAVQVVQGTAGGPVVGSLDIEVDLYHLDHVLKTLTATLDASGVALIENVPLPVEVRPVVRLQYAGVTYLEVGAPLSAERNEGVVTLTVFETTDEAPLWHVSMRHVMVEPHSDGAAVAETLVVENPGDRTWLGEATDGGAERPTIRVSLPEGADQVQLESGFHGWCCTVLTGSDLIVKMPLMPGRTSFRYSYHVPATGKRAEVRISSPAPTAQAVFFVPEGATTVSPIALDHLGVEQMGQMRVNMYRAADLAGGVEAGVMLAGLTSAVATTPTTPTGATAAHAQRAALIGVGLVLAVSAGLFGAHMLKRRGAPGA